MRRFVIILLFVTSLLVVALILKREANDTYYTVEERLLKKLVYASGVVKPVEYVIVRSEVSGYVKEVYVRENQKVAKGQKLALIDAGSLAHTLKEVQSRISLTEDKLKPDSSYMKALQDDIQRLEIKLQHERKLLERREALFQRGLIPKEQYENAKASYEITQKEYEKALAAYQDNISSLKREREILQSQLNRIKTELDRYYITSPMDGFVLKKYVNVGDYINAVSQDNRLFSIGNPTKWEVVLDVDEEFLEFVKEGMTAYVTLDVFPKETFKGVVREIIKDVDKGRRVFQVKVFVELPKETPANATAEANITVYEKKALVIPKEAYRNGKVIKFDGVRLNEVDVKVGVEVDNYLEVLEGLKAGDRVKLK